MEKFYQLLKNILYIAAGVAGAIFGATLFNNGFIYAGGGIVLVFCGLYIAWHGLKSIINKDSGHESDENSPSDSTPKHPGKKKKKKKNTRK